MRLSVRRINPNAKIRPTKEQLKLLTLKRERQNYLSSEIQTEVSQGAQILNNRMKNGRGDNTYKIAADYFIDNSVLRIMYYDHIEDEAQRADTIEADTVFVYAEVRRLNDKYKLWNVSIHKLRKDDINTYVIVVKEK
jgi:hypothetical protein